MSHELRTPMNAILGMTSLALRRTTDPQLVDKLKKIDNASHLLLSVINDILDISKIEAGRLTLERVSFKFGSVLESVMNIVGQRVAEKGLKLFIDLPSEVARLSLLGDPLRLGQILLNLTGNAVKFTAQGAVTVRIMKLEESQDDVLLRCEVQDSGIGITPEEQRRLFIAFEQADGSMTRKYGGTGLGLVISRRLAELMGGDIGLISTAGLGSTFWLIVRFSKAGKDAVAPAPTSAAGSAEMQLKTCHAGTRILLAEDEPINQEVSRGLLEDVGLTVELAEDGGVAVAMAQRSHYDLILMDMQMPQMNGVEATRVIRALPGYAQTPILAMTANAFEEDRKICLESGMDDHISKPVAPEVLYAILVKWLQRARG
jgi:CheY-like chemotaxis protein/two-component sensor histidine kinase